MVDWALKTNNQSINSPLGFFSVLVIPLLSECTDDLLLNSMEVDTCTPTKTLEKKALSVYVIGPLWA